MTKQITKNFKALEFGSPNGRGIFNDQGDLEVKMDRNLWIQQQFMEYKAPSFPEIMSIKEAGQYYAWDAVTPADYSKWNTYRPKPMYLQRWEWGEDAARRVLRFFKLIPLKKLSWQDIEFSHDVVIHSARQMGKTAYQSIEASKGLQSFADATGAGSFSRKAMREAVKQLHKEMLENDMKEFEKVFYGPDKFHELTKLKVGYGSWQNIKNYGGIT